MAALGVSLLLPVLCRVLNAWTGNARVSRECGQSAVQLVPITSSVDRFRTASLRFCNLIVTKVSRAVRQRLDSLSVNVFSSVIKVEIGSSVGMEAGSSSFK